MFNFEIKHRLTGSVMFTAELEKDTGSVSLNIGLAARAAIKAGANLTGADLTGADLTGAYLTGADLTGADLTGADLTGADLSGAYLKYAYLTGADLKDANLRGAYLEGAYLTGAYLTGADLTGADLTGADLSGADLSGAYLKYANFEDVPVIEKIHQAVYAAASQDGALDMSRWHCGTTHCRAGWVVTLAGEEGRKLEEKFDTATAAYLIYRKSDPDTAFALNFYDTNANALAEMKRMAELEAAK